MPGNFRVVSVGSAVTQIVSYNPNRKLILVLNESDYTIYVSKDPMNVKELGIAVYPFESIVFDVADSDSPEEALYAVSEGVSKVRIYEAVV